jgi:hypothetical protein
VYVRGSTNPPAIEKSFRVPAEEKTGSEMAEMAEMASINDGLPKSLKSDSQRPVWDAAAGKPLTPTALVKVRASLCQSRSRD